EDKEHHRNKWFRAVRVETHGETPYAEIERVPHHKETSGHLRDLFEDRRRMAGAKEGLDGATKKQGVAATSWPRIGEK
ncbi:MAG TPA: hypothetical protein VNO21_22680, partial [Polyangiaceae bacterium]|nr:hypothetical protein [Polyangiaceae bacterium]